MKETHQWRSNWSQDFRVFLGIAGINGLAHFFLSYQLGLYEDDHFRIPEAMGMTVAQIGQYINEHLFNLTITQGRPLHLISIYLFSFLGQKVGGLLGIYVVAYLITTVTIFLFYKFLDRLQVNPVFTLCGTLAFTLYPADTTRIWLTSVFGIYFSVTLLIIAFHSYLSQKKGIAYGILASSLFLYETVFWLFLFVPLFQTKNQRNLYKEMGINTGILSIIFLSVILLRKTSGESRIVNLDTITILKTVFWQSLIGPFTSLQMFWRSPLNTLSSIPFVNLVPFLIIALILIGLFLRPLNSVKSSETLKNIPQILTIGSLMLILAYPLTFTVAANVMQGVGTRVHFAGIVGSSLIVGSLCSLIFSGLGNYRGKKVAIAVFSLFFSLLVGSGILVQKDYQLNWQYQQQFWRQLIELILDIEEDNLVLIDHKDFPYAQTQQMRANDWHLPIILQQLYHFPKEWKTIPKVYLAAYHWRENFVIDGENFRLNLSTLAASPDHFPIPNQESTIPSHKVILIETQEGKLQRPTTVILGDKIYFLKPKTNPILPQLAHKPLYNYLLPYKLNFVYPPNNL